MKNQLEEFKEEVIAFLTKNAMEREEETDYPDDIDEGVSQEFDSYLGYEDLA